MRGYRRNPYRGFATADLQAFVDRMVDEGTDQTLAIAIGVDAVVQNRVS